MQKDDYLTETCDSQIAKEYFGVDIASDFSEMKKEIRSLILDAKQYMREKLELTFSRIKQGKRVFVSDLFFTVFFNAVFTYKTVQENSQLIREFIDQLRDERGGCKPSNLFQYKWQDKTRIYSTYYSLMLLELMGVATEFLKRSSTWCINTYTWLCEHQVSEGNDSGSFVELDSPTGILPENSYWAISCLKVLGNFVPSETKAKHSEIIGNAVKWVLRFLREKKRWSVTRLYYALNLLKITNNLGLLNSEDKFSIVNFLEQVHYNKGFHEFHLEKVKAGYRKEKTHEFAFVHSTFNALTIFKLLGCEDKFKSHLENAKELVLLHQHHKAFGVQIMVKDYKYGPNITPYETLCATLILLS